MRLWIAHCSWYQPQPNVGGGIARRCSNPRLTPQPGSPGSTAAPGEEVHPKWNAPGKPEHFFSFRSCPYKEDWYCLVCGYWADENHVFGDGSQEKTPESETGEWWVKHNNKMWYGPAHETRGQPEAAPLLPPPPLPPPLLPRMAPLRPRSHSRGLASNETHCAGVRNVGLVEARVGSARRRCRERRLGSRPMASAYRERTTSGTAGGSAGGGKSGGKTGGEGVGKAGGKAIGDTRHVLGDSTGTEMGPQNITNNRVSPLAAEDPKQLL